MFFFSPRGTDRHLDDKGASNDSWKPKSRDDKRVITSPSSSERRTELNSEKSDNWRTVEKKRPNPYDSNSQFPFLFIFFPNLVHAMKTIVHPNNVQANHHPQMELGDRNPVCPMKLAIIFVMVPIRIHQLIGPDPMTIVIGVHERKNV
jgi:hypothetical protein